MTKPLLIATALVALFLPIRSAHAQTHPADRSHSAPMRVLLLDGQSGGPWHNWRLTTPVLREELDETGLFQVTVLTAPPSDGDFSAFKP
ncbi:MAG TPA: hypothetical protein VNL71_16205, partial [Chloroflexota bacterium]|nr:hypothetical protein [Chloroflexota bacterium]